MYPKPLYAVHGANSLDYDGWVVLTRGIGHDPDDHGGEDFSHYRQMPIARLNNGYGEAGTIPLPEHYADFAQRCANFVQASQGCHIWIIGNEPNMEIERPEGQPITPHQYAECYSLCRAWIRSVQYHSGDQVLVAAVAPWNVQSGDWIPYFQEIQAVIPAGGLDGFAIHSYWREQVPQSVTSSATMEQPYEDRFWSFRHYINWMASILTKHQGLPVYLTEMCTAGEPWDDVNTGCVQAAYREIDGWNSQHQDRPICCLALYRWDFDQWTIKDKPQVHADFYAAVAQGYTWPQTEPEPPEETMLLNPSFEGDWYKQTADGILVLPDYWRAEYHEGDVPYKRPEIKPNQEFATDGVYSIRAFPPAHSRGFYGICQEIDTEPGQWYRFSADVRVESNPPGKLGAFVGIQPWGGSIFHRQMIWGEEIVNSHDWTRVEVIAQSFGVRIKVAMGADNEYPSANNTTWWDNASLELFECNGETEPPVEPPEPGQCHALTEGQIRDIVRDELIGRDPVVWPNE